MPPRRFGHLAAGKRYRDKRHFERPKELYHTIFSIYRLEYTRFLPIMTGGEK